METGRKKNPFAVCAAVALFWIPAMFFGWVLCSGVFGAPWWLGPAVVAGIFSMALGVALNTENKER